MLIESKVFNYYKKAYTKSFVSKDNLDICVMLSSGVDSVALAHFICTNKKLVARLFSVKNVNVKLYHFNHNLRKQNDLMESKAIELAKFLDTEIIIKRADNDCSTEQKAREQRFKFFEDYDGVILTAHHINDCVESYVMNVFRGHENRQPIPFFTAFHNACIAHLLLFTEKKTLISYSNHYNLDKYVVEDETNKVIKGSRRNLIRNKIIPLLSEENINLSTVVRKKMLVKLTS